MKSNGAESVTTQVPMKIEEIVDQEKGPEDEDERQKNISIEETTTVGTKKPEKVGTKENMDEKEDDINVSSRHKSNDERKPKEKKVTKSVKEEPKNQEELENTPLVKVDGEVKVAIAIDGETKNRHHKSEANRGLSDEDSYNKISDGIKIKQKLKNSGKEEDKTNRKDYSEEQESKEIENEMGSFEKFDGKIQKQESTRNSTTEEKNINEDDECEPDGISTYNNDIASSINTISSTSDKMSSEEVSKTKFIKDDYHNFDITKCIDEEDIDDSNDISESTKEREKKLKKLEKMNKRRSHENIKKRKERRLETKCKKDIKKKNESSFQKGENTDYQLSKESMNKINSGHIIDEVHASEDLEIMKLNGKEHNFGLNCASETDEFPQKCIAWQKAGFCESNQATQYLWCRKTCLCKWRRS
uniref:ShKT domain-containing protein n=1 Tax=Heterorhabditis bacteriophora TaxID=37862 RepID=A0A1I7WV06_HETBA